MTEDAFTKLKAALVSHLDLHKDEIEAGYLNWFSVKVTLARGEIRATFLSEENCPIPHSADEKRFHALVLTGKSR